MWRGQIERVRIAASERGAGIGRAMLLWAIEVYTSGASGLGLGWPTAF